MIGNPREILKLPAAVKNVQQFATFNFICFKTSHTHQPLMSRRCGFKTLQTTGNIWITRISRIYRSEAGKRNYFDCLAIKENKHNSNLFVES